MKTELSTLITLLMSFCLSTFAYIMAQPDDIPVQHIEFDEFHIHPMGDYVLMDEEVIVSQHNNTDADGAGIDWEKNQEFWCAIHPDECQKADDDEDDGSDEEEGC